MATIKGTNVLAPVVPFDTADVHPSHEARYGKGGYRTVATTTERDAIPAPRREAGMLVFVTASGGSLWQLSGDLTTWTAFASGGGVVGPAGPQGPPGQAGAKGDPGDPATNLVSSVAGRTGAVTLGKSDVGLANVDNTSDASKPVSTATQTALDGKAATSHTHAADAITSGTIATARLGSGAASASNFLRGDGTWATAGSSSASDLTSGTLSNARLTARARAAVNVFNWSSFR